MSYGVFDCIPDLYKIIPKVQIGFNIPMEKHTSIKVGGPVDIFLRVKTVDEVKAILKMSKKHKIPIYMIGNGTNLLVSDVGIRGIVMKSEIEDVKTKRIGDDLEITLGSGVRLAAIAQTFQRKGIEGFEFASGIPGTMGGAVKMNAGAHGKEMKDIVLRSTVMDMDGNIKTIEGKDHNFGYRYSIFARKKYFILDTTIKLRLGMRDEIRRKMDEYAMWRKEHQPLEYPSAGSTFKRGKDYITAKLIDDCGLKGYTIGGAQVSEKHAGFIINIGGATAKDVFDLIKYVRTTVYRKYNKKIVLELDVFKEEGNEKTK